MLTFLIVVMHSETPERFGQELSWESYPFIWSIFRLTKIAVPTFFFISALLFYRNCEWKDIPIKLQRRIFSLIIPFLIWNIFFTGFYVVLDFIPALANKMNGGSGIHDIRGFIYAVIETRFTPLWFVKYLIIYSILSPVILLVIKNQWIGIVSTLVIFGGCIYYDWGYFSLQHWMPVYLAGALIGRYLYAPGHNEYGTLWEEMNHTTRSTLILAFVIALYFAFAHEKDLIYYETIGALSLWFIVDGFVFSFINRVVIRKWMGCMFMIYAMHYMIINIIEGTIRAFLPHTAFVMNVTFIITPFLTIVIVIAISNILSRFSFYKYLSGGRG